MLVQIKQVPYEAVAERIHLLLRVWGITNYKHNENY